MSVSFFVATRGDDGVTRPACGGHVCPIGCEDGAYGWCGHIDDAAAACRYCSVEANVSNTNAAAILDRLGVEFDYCGAIDAADLLGRALVGNIGRDDSGAASVTDGRITQAAIRAGYFESALGRLADAATVAAADGLLVAWG